ncbi:MAG TPA: AAA-associated domain-containing protein [Vicinamibacterales bacterium]|jgi:NitT/TauT family transport system ATP-binding protein|nr:AAA-associated domain-containing protein [Vicinamibacterales bacterium]
MRGTPEEFRRLVSEARWDHAIALLRWFEPSDGAEAFKSLPADEQEALFRALPVDLAAGLVESLPYYQAYVLLRSRPVDEVTAVLDALSPFARLQLFEELSGDAWRQLVQGAGEGSPQVARSSERPEGPPPTAVAPRVAILEAKGIEKVFHRPEGGVVQVIAPLDLSLTAGMIVAVLGPSGSGKSTLLRMLSGLTPPSGGEVLWRGETVGESLPRAAIVFQSFALFPWLTVLENVEVPLVARGVARPERRRRALRTLESVGLKGFENAYPKELSGGMKQRVGFARALAVEPEILFMDEPFSALDVLTAENLRGELMELWLARKIPTQSIFLVTHNIEEAVLLADRIIVLGRNPGRIRADFEVPLRQHRDRHSHEFVLYVDYIYKMMTQPLVEPGPLAPHAASPDQHQVLPHAKRGAIAGFLELLNGRSGKDDLYRVASDLQMDVDDLLPIVEGATLLSFATSDRGDVALTPAGKAFAEATIEDRKRLFREAILAKVAILRQIHTVLHGKPDHTMPLEFFRDLLQRRFSDDEARHQIETALNWGRYGDLFTYDATSDRLSLHEAMPGGGDETGEP